MGNISLPDLVAKLLATKMVLGVPNTATFIVSVLATIVTDNRRHYDPQIAHLLARVEQALEEVD